MKLKPLNHRCALGKGHNDLTTEMGVLGDRGFMRFEPKMSFGATQAIILYNELEIIFLELLKRLPGQVVYIEDKQVVVLYENKINCLPHTAVAKI